MAALIAYLFLALFVSSLCSVMEAVLLSTPRSFLLVKEKKGYRWAGSFIKMKNDIDKPLSAILSLNTVAHTIGAAGVGAQAVEVFGEMYFGIASAILTVLILVFTEIIPKTIGARFWNRLTMIAYYIMRIMIIITYPLVLLSSLITGIFSKDKKEKSVSREELAVMAGIGADEGVFSQKENKIIQNVIKLKNIKVTEVMTPRVVTASADENLLLTDFFKNRECLRFSRIPVYSEKADNITGYVLKHTVLQKLAENNNKLRLKDIKRDILTVPQSMELLSLWEKFIAGREHIALIVDEYGGMDGVVTMEDVIETLLGLEIVDEMDKYTDMQKYARERWKARQEKYSLMDTLDKV